MMDGLMPQLSRKEWALSIAIPAISFGGAGIGILLFTRGIIADAGSFYGGVLVGSFLLAYLAWIKPRRDIVALLAPLYAVIIFVLPLEVKPTLLLQLLFAVSLTVLVIRLNIRFSTLPAKDKYEDPMDKFLYAYMHRITPYFRAVDSDTAHEIASAVLSFKFGIYPNAISGADRAIAQLEGEGAFATLRKVLTIIRDRAESLQESMVKSYSEKTFFTDDFQYLAIVLPPELIESPENYTLDNAVILAYAVAYLCSPDDGQRLDEHQNFVIQILSFYKEAMEQAAGRQG